MATPSGSVKMVVRDSAKLITGGWIDAWFYEGRGETAGSFLPHARRLHNASRCEIPQARRITIREAIRGSSDVNALFIVAGDDACCTLRI